MNDRHNDSLNWLDGELASLESAHLRRVLRQRQSAQGPTILVDGRKLINFGSNDYLGLAADPRLVRAAIEAAEREGWGSGASPLVIGRGPALAALETRLARFEGAEAALVFPSGFAANMATIPALVGRDDVIFADQWNHASLIDGCRLSRATVQVYPHVDMAQLEQLLAGADRFRRRLIVTDGLFSMDGDLAPLDKLAELARRFKCMLLVDEAHATGVLGPTGRGAAELFGVEDLVPIRIGTLSKALGSAGGFVSGSRSLIDWLANKARAYVFSTAPPGPVCAAAEAALTIVESEPERRTDLLAKADKLRERLRAQGWTLGASTSQIVPVVVGEAERATAMQARLMERGLYVPAIRPPSVPEGSSRLRISLSAAHSNAMLEELAEVTNDEL